MATPVDSLFVGEWIAVTGYKGHTCKRPADGRPFQVKAICLPFLALHDGEEAATLDVRVIEFVKLSKLYVKTVMQAVRPEPEQADPFRCVRCGERLRQTFTKRGGWRSVCPGCGSDFGPVDAEKK